MDDAERAQATADLDQKAALVADVLPGLWARLFINLLGAGFPPGTALTLLQTYILATCATGGVHGHS